MSQGYYATKPLNELLQDQYVQVYDHGLFVVSGDFLCIWSYEQLPVVPARFRKLVAWEWYHEVGRKPFVATQLYGSRFKSYAQIALRSGDEPSPEFTRRCWEQYAARRNRE
jgi:hypothetical protein